MTKEVQTLPSQNSRSELLQSPGSRRDSRGGSPNVVEEKDTHSEDEEELNDEVRGDRFMVHDAALYTEVLDASDWTEVLRSEKRRKKREALAQHSVEEANERDRRDQLRKKAAEDAKAVREARKKLLSAAREERETLAFRERNDEFFVRHNALLSHWEPIQRTNQNYHDRVREQIYRRWEREVFIPSQREINRKVEAKCASDTRPHTFDKRVRAATEGGNRKASTWGSGGTVPLTWKERKDELWKSFLAESNRKSKIGGRAGLFLDVIDEVEYDPIAQRKADTITYKKRTLPTSDTDQHRLEAQQLELQYSVLGLAYRDQERKSCTGILREHQKPPMGSTTAGSSGTGSSCIGQRDGPSVSFEQGPAGSASSTRNKDQAGRSVSAEEDGSAGLPAQFPPAPPVYAMETHSAYSIPHTHVPYDFAKQFHHRTGARSTGTGTGTENRPRTGSSPRESRAVSGVGEIEPQKLSSPHDSCATSNNRALANNSVSSRRRLPRRHAPPVDRTLALASITGEGAAAKSIKETSTSWRKKVDDQHAEERRCLLEDRHQSPLALAAQQQHREQNILECDRLVMPLPLKPTPAPPTERSKHLLPWMCTTGGKESIHERAHYLPVRQWAKAQLHESVYGHYVHPDGSLRPPPENKTEGGWRIHDSNVSFDHFNFPKENEAMHTGKRMCVYYQM